MTIQMFAIIMSLIAVIIGIVFTAISAQNGFLMRRIITGTDQKFEKLFDIVNKINVTLAAILEDDKNKASNCANLHNLINEKFKEIDSKFKKSNKE